MKITKSPFIILSAFIIISLLIFLKTDDIFFLFNFTYIGVCITIGLVLFENKVKYSRNFVLLAVGSYLLFYLGVFGHENLLISGFWYFLFLGVFEAAVIHFLVAKIAGPLVFGRGFCGYACWLAMIFDLLPYKRHNDDRKPYEYFRYVLFIVILMVVGAVFVFKIEDSNEILFWMFILGNIIYYAVGIAMAFAFKDNRAFCKYVCPVTVFLKPASYFSLLRVKVDESKCNKCNKCLIVCPMDVDILDNSRSRKHGTECILCCECVKACKQDALKL